MSLRRFLGSAMAAISLAATLSAAPASAQWSSQPTMVGDHAATVVRETESWISVAWTAPTQMSNFRMEAVTWQDGTRISYASDSSARLRQGDTLSPGELDLASFKLSTSESAPDEIFVQIVARWEHEGTSYEFFPGGLNVRVVDGTGADLVVLTAAARVASVGNGDANWIDLDLLGLASRVADIEITMTGGEQIYYPQVTFTSPHHDNVLYAGEEDTARIWIDPAYAVPGESELTVTIAYTISGEAHSLTTPFTLTVD